MKTMSTATSGWLLRFTIVFLLIFLSPLHSQAADKYWVCGSSWWDYSNCWGPAGQPQNGDNVYLRQSDAVNRTVSYWNTAYPTAVINWFEIDATGTGTMTFSQSRDSLITTNEFIGYNGKGTYSQSGGSHDVYSLRVGTLSSSNGFYNLSGTGSLTSDYEFIGQYGTGTFTQTGGSHSISTDFYLGNFSSGSGTYNLSGTGSLAGLVEYVGYYGTGQFTQTGGTNSVSDDLVIGWNSGSNGSYNLNGGSLSVNDVEGVGIYGNGSFSQSGGTNSISATGILLVGRREGANGYFILSGGSLSSPDEEVGTWGSGVFTQTGGTNTVSNKLAISGNVVTGDTSGSGVYDLSGGVLTANIIELYDGGTFTQNGGTLNAATFNQNGGTVNGTLQNQGIYNYISGIFAGRLFNQGTANFNADFTAGDGIENYGDFAIGAGRTVTVNGSGLDNQGTITMSGGTLGGDGRLVNNANMSGYGVITGTDGFINNALLTQSGGNITISNTGDNYNYGNIDLASGRLMTINNSSLDNAGTLNINSAIINGSGTLNNVYGGTISGRGTISSNFNNAGGVMVVGNGTTNVQKDFNNSGLIQLTNYTANLTGGAITNTGKIEGYGNVGNNIVNTGNIEAKSGTLALSGTVNNNSGGLMTASSGSELFVTRGLAANSGIINISGGTFDNNNKVMTNTGQISGHGTFRSGGLTNSGSVTFTGGNTTVNGNVTNQASGNIEIAHTPALFTGDVTNFGTVKTTNTTVTFAGNYTENGTYISDPSDNYFTNLFIGETGHLIGGFGDNWFISNDFVNNSSQNTNWNTGSAYLGFTAGTDNSHNLYLAGYDYGALVSGYTNNFAWGTLALNSGETIYLYDGDSTTGGAMYTGAILGIDFTGTQVNNIYGNGFNIYYDQNNSANSYLGGQTFNLAGGGVLAPTVVPEPVSTILFVTGGVLLGGRRLLKKRNRV
jgi:hypothetical protein